MSEAEKELCELCHEFFELKQEKGSMSPIIDFFSKLMNANQTINISDDIRHYVPMLTRANDGALCPILASTINGLSPTDYVPRLNLNFTITPPDDNVCSKSSRAPRPKFRNKSARITNSNLSPRLRKGVGRTKDISEWPIPEVRLPDSSRRAPDVESLLSSRTIKSRCGLTLKKPLPPLNQTQSDVLGALYTSSNTKFFMGKKKKKDSHDWHIIPPTYPEHLIGLEWSVMSTNGMITAKDGIHATAQDLYKFVDDKTNEFIVENQMIRVRASYRSFYTWRERFKERLFLKLIKTYDDYNDVSIPNFQSVMDGIRMDILSTLEDTSIYPSSFDILNEEVEFKEIKDTAHNSVHSLERRISALRDQTGQKISEVFRSVRASNVLIQLGFDELNSLNQLPASLKQYSSDLKWRIPSMWRERMRKIQLNKERKLARDRQDYLPTFFSKIRIHYNGLLVLRCKDTIMNYLDRFTQEPQGRRRTNRIHALFHPEHGIIITPTREEFIAWIERTIASIKSAFLQSLESIWCDIILETDPNYEYTIEDPLKLLARYHELDIRLKEVMNAINSAFKYMEEELSQHVDFCKKVISLIDNSALFNELRDVDKLQMLLQSLLNIKDELDHRPRTLFHKIGQQGETLDDFVVDLRPVQYSMKEMYESGMSALRLRILNELNLLFIEIQDKWAEVKEKKISRSDALSLETRTAQYSLLCDAFCTAWPDSRAELRASFDTVMRMYRQLNDKSRYTHPSAVKHFNKVAETLGLASLNISEGEDEFEEEEEYYEEEEEATKKE